NIAKPIRKSNQGFSYDVPDEEKSPEIGASDNTAVFGCVVVEAQSDLECCQYEEFPMVIGLTDKLKLTVKCGKLYEVQVVDAFQTHNQEVLRVPFPVWDDYKPYSATKVETFGNDLKNAVAKGLTQCEESPCSIAAFSPIVAGKSCQELSEVYIGFGILEFLKETKGVLQEIQIVGEDEKILFDMHHCLSYMVQSNTQPPWFDISIFMTTDVDANRFKQLSRSSI
ncbi:hypothetical protein MAR_034583, partial [Mya arenaria]